MQHIQSEIEVHKTQCIGLEEKCRETNHWKIHVSITTAIYMRCHLQFNGHPRASLTWILVPREAVIRIIRESLLVLSISHMCRVFQSHSNVKGVDITLRQLSKGNVAVTILVKQADLQPCGSINISTVKKGFQKNQIY